MGVKKCAGRFDFVLPLGVEPLQHDVRVANDADRGHPAPLAERGSHGRTRSPAAPTVLRGRVGAPRQPQADPANQADAALPLAGTRCGSVPGSRFLDRSAPTDRLGSSPEPLLPLPYEHPNKEISVRYLLDDL